MSQYNLFLILARETHKLLDSSLEEDGTNGIGPRGGPQTPKQREAILMRVSVEVSVDGQRLVDGLPECPAITIKFQVLFLLPLGWIENVQ